MRFIKNYYNKLRNTISSLKDRRIQLENRLNDYKKKNSTLNYDQNNLIITNANLKNDYSTRINSLKQHKNILISENNNISERINLANAVNNSNKEIIKSFEGFDGLEGYANTDNILNNLSLDNIESRKTALLNQSKLYAIIDQQNNILIDRYNYVKNQFTRHDNKNDYYLEYNNQLLFFNKILFYVFYILIFVYAIILVLYRPNMGGYFKLFIIISLAIYPHIVYTIEKFLYNAWNFIYSILSGSVYKSLSYSNSIILKNTTDLTIND